MLKCCINTGHDVRRCFMLRDGCCMLHVYVCCGMIFECFRDSRERDGGRDRDGRRRSADG